MAPKARAIRPGCRDPRPFDRELPGRFAARLAGLRVGARRAPEPREEVREEPREDERVVEREEPLAERARDVRGEADVRDAMGERLSVGPQESR